jgi:hypothetical protein
LFNFKKYQNCSDHNKNGSSVRGTFMHAFATDHNATLSQVSVRVGGSPAAAAAGPWRTSNDCRAPLPLFVPARVTVDAEEQEWPPRPLVAHRSRDQVVTPRSLWIPAAGVVGRIQSYSRWMTMTRRSARRRDAISRGGRQRREGQHDDQRSYGGDG